MWMGGHSGDVMQSDHTFRGWKEEEQQQQNHNQRARQKNHRRQQGDGLAKQHPHLPTIRRTCLTIPAGLHARLFSAWRRWPRRRGCSGWRWHLLFCVACLLSTACRLLFWT